jgi:hypothetical protein
MKADIDEYLKVPLNWPVNLWLIYKLNFCNIRLFANTYFILYSFTDIYFV